MLNGSSIRYKNLSTELVNFKESNASNYNADSSVVLQLCLVEFQKKAFFNSQMMCSYIFFSTY